jgi:hypothetical protein
MIDLANWPCRVLIALMSFILFDPVISPADLVAAFFLATFFLAAILPTPLLSITD